MTLTATPPRDELADFLPTPQEQPMPHGVTPEAIDFLTTEITFVTPLGIRTIIIGDLPLRMFRPTPAVHEEEARAAVYACVEKGMQWMRTYAPDDWLSRIDLLTLDIGSSMQCVLGQVFGSFWEGQIQVVRSGYVTSDCGFALSSALAFRGSYDALNEYWHVAIQEERARKKDSVLCH